MDFSHYAWEYYSQLLLLNLISSVSENAEGKRVETGAFFKCSVLIKWNALNLRHRLGSSIGAGGETSV